MNRYSITKQPSEVLKSTALKLREIRKGDTGHISMESFLKLLHVLNRLEEFDSILKQESDLKAVEKLFSTKTTRR